jgi:hypothetical protein
MVRPDRCRELEGTAIVTIVAQEIDKSVRRIQCGLDEAICFDTSVSSAQGHELIATTEQSRVRKELTPVPRMSIGYVIMGRLFVRYAKLPAPHLLAGRHTPRNGLLAMIALMRHDNDALRTVVGLKNVEFERVGRNDDEQAPSL